MLLYFQYSSIAIISVLSNTSVNNIYTAANPNTTAGAGTGEA